MKKVILALPRVIVSVSIVLFTLILLNDAEGFGLLSNQRIFSNGRGLVNDSRSSDHGGSLTDKFLLAVNVARLYSAQPDQQLAMPVRDVSKSQVGNSWHAARDGGERLHQGQDIFAPRGTRVLSATDGYIVQVGENRLGGQTVSVMGAGGRMYYYAHLDAYAPQIAIGDHVTTETVLGYVGTTGNAAGTPPHLHFGVYTTGGPLDPLPLLTDRAAAEEKIRPTKKQSK